MSHEQELIIAIVALAGAVATLWILHTKAYSKLEARTELCEQDRLKLWEKIAELSSRVGFCENCPEKPKKVNSQKI